jgi:hypothetical protein
MWATAGGDSCAEAHGTIDQASCTCPSASTCQAVSPGDLVNVMSWFYDAEGDAPSCIVPGEGP